jgi:hypothetical protein
LIFKHLNLLDVCTMCKKDILQYYIDAREILRFPNEIKTGISPSEMKIFILLFKTQYRRRHNQRYHLAFDNKKKPKSLFLATYYCKQNVINSILVTTLVFRISKINYS